MRSLLAALVYFAIVFAAGFAMGMARVTALAPRLGEFAAVALELPVMLVVSWFSCRRLVGRLRVPAHIAPRAVMGGVAFVLLMAAEMTLAVAGFGRTPVEAVLEFAKPAGALGLAGQIAFALFPLLQLARTPTSTAH